MNRLIIHFHKTHQVMEFNSAAEAYDYANNHVSLTGNKVARIELETEPGSVRALWDYRWTPESQRAAMTFPVHPVGPIFPRTISKE